MKLLAGNFLQTFVTFSFLGTISFLNTIFSNILSLRSSLSFGGHYSHPHKITGKITLLYFSIFGPDFVIGKRSVRGPYKMN